MNQSFEQHEPAPDFVDALEARIVTEYRHTQSPSKLPPSLLRKRGVRTTLTLITGLAIGAGTMVASAQVQNTQQRDSLLTAIDLRRVVAAMRLEVAGLAQKQVMLGVKTGARPESDAFQAQHDVMAAQYALKRVDLDIDEVRATSMPVRDELWAPLVGKRDFVLERLEVEQSAWLDRFSQNAEQVTRLGARLRAGIIPEPSDSDKVLSYEMAEIDVTVRMITEKKIMREQFLKGEMGEKQISTKLAVLEVQRAVTLLSTKLEFAQQRAKRARDRSAVGAASQIDVKRAELEVLETNQDYERLREQLKRLQAAQGTIKKD